MAISTVNGRRPAVQERHPDLAAVLVGFGDVVRAKRKSLGLSQEKLAELAGCDRQSVNRVENAAYVPSLTRALHLAAALGVPLAQLLAEAEAAATTGRTA